MTTPIPPSNDPFAAPVPVPPAGIPLTQPSGFTQADLQRAIEAAQAQAEQRFSGQLTQLNSQFQEAQQKLSTFEQERQQALDAAKAETDRLAAEARAAAEENLSFKELLAKRDQENAAKFTQLEREIATRDALLEKEREYAALEAYKAQAINSVREPKPEQGHYGIADQFIDLIHGSTQAELDASISTMVAKTRSILEEMQQVRTQNYAAMPGVSPTAGNIGVLDQQDQVRTFSPEEIAALPPGSPEHMRLRANYGMGGPGNRGMFG
jgi:vacuolar-type H+-ATPase subunit I/STV1